jgi:UDPglucose 6-dehydrogenase
MLPLAALDTVMSMNVAVIGMGHVGLPTAVSLATLGHAVVATDVDRAKVADLLEGRLPFYEPGLDGLLRASVGSGHLRFEDETSMAGIGQDVAFICVGTPPRANGEANLMAVERAATELAVNATTDLVVVEKSTVPAGTAARIEQTLRRHNPERRFAVVSNPEFLREGRAIEDALRPGRILVGSDSPEALSIMCKLYAPLVEGGAQLIETDVRTAELAKHACNAFLAMKISYANALAAICELAGADVVAVADTMGADPRIGREFLNPGLGYGGYCFPKDLAAFRALAGGLGYDFPLLDEIARINDQAIERAMSKIQSVLWNLEEKRIAVLGLAFKPETDDVRFSPAIALVRRLIAAGASVVGCDPRAAANARGEIPDLEVTEDPFEALRGAHCAVLCTEWADFGYLDLGRAKDLMALPILVDGRNALDPAAAARAGFTYLPTGRAAVDAPIPVP